MVVTFATLGPINDERQCQRSDNASNTDLIDINTDAPKEVRNTFASDTIVFNENCIAKVTKLTLMLSVNGPLGGRLEVDCVSFCLLDRNYRDSKSIRS